MPGVLLAKGLVVALNVVGSRRLWLWPSPTCWDKPWLLLRCADKPRGCEFDEIVRLLVVVVVCTRVMAMRYFSICAAATAVVQTSLMAAH
jgi:hypothetical protein